MPQSAGKHGNKVKHRLVVFPRKKFPRIRCFVCVNLSRIQFISKISITSLASVPFQYHMKISVNRLIIGSFRKPSVFLERVLLDAIGLTSTFEALPQLTLVPASLSELWAFMQVSFSARTRKTLVRSATCAFQTNGHTKLLYLLETRYWKVLMYFVCVCSLYFLQKSLPEGVGRVLYTLRSSKLIAIFSKRLFCYFREIQYAFRIRLFWETLVNGTLKERPGSFKYTWIYQVSGNIEIKTLAKV